MLHSMLVNVLLYGVDCGGKELTLYFLATI